MSLQKMNAEKPLNELPDDLDIATTKDWSYGMWGYADYRIEHVHSDGSADIYRIPYTIGRIIEQERRHAADEVRKEIRKVLDI
jgi:hypothetical protein